MAIVFEPTRLNKSATAAGLPISELWNTVEGISGTETKQFERITVLVEPFPGGNVAFMPAFVLRYPAGTDARKQLPILLGEVKDAKIGDIAYVRSTKFKLAKVEMAGYAVDDRTVLVAPWPTLELMLKPTGAGDKDRPLGAELAKLDPTGDAVLVITPAPLLKRIAEIEKQGGEKITDPIFTAVGPALEKVVAITVNLDFSKDMLLRVEFRSADAAAAGVVHDTLKDLLAKAKEAYPDVRKTLEKEFPPEMAKSLLPFIDEAVKGHVLTKDGASVVVAVARPKGQAPKK